MMELHMHNKEYREKMIKASLFRKNSLPYAMILVSILFELAYTVWVLDDIEVSFMMGLITIVNIFVLFMLFACAVKTSTYKTGWVIASLAIGGYAVVRAFLIVPFVLHPQTLQNRLMICNLVLAFLCIAASLRSLLIIAKRNEFLKTEEASYLLAKDIVR